MRQAKRVAAIIFLVAMLLLMMLMVFPLELKLIDAADHWWFGK